MSYNTIEFFIFLFVFLILYLIIPRPLPKQAVILTGNFIFYCYAGTSTFVIVFGVSVIVYATSRILELIYSGYEKKKGELTPSEQVALLAKYKKRCKPFLWLSIILIVGMLVYVKIGKVYEWEEVELLEEFSFGKLIVPLGISYYTFSSVGYLLDIYWRKAKCQHNYLKLFACMTYFPHIVQGPICRYDKLMKQFDCLPGYDNKRVCYGLQLLLWGTFKKMVIADRMVLFINTVMAEPELFAGVEIFLTVAGSAIWLYADFSGCMDMVTGVAQVMGVTLDKNFNQPFFSKSAPEFWRRWHITLGAWYKDYILMPIATNHKFMKAGVFIRKKVGVRASRFFSTAIPAMVVWVLTGMWHGTGMPYLVWGLYWGALIILSSTFEPEFKALNKLFGFRVESLGFQVFRMIRTFLLFCIGRMFTMAGTLEGMRLLWERLFAEPRLYTLFDGSLYTHGLDQKNFYVVLFGLTIMWLVSILHERGVKIRDEIASMPLVVRWPIYYGAIVLILIFGVYGVGFDAMNFAYGAF